MAGSPLSSPVVLDGILSDEKLGELFALQVEYPELDYKATIDLTTTEGRVQMAKDVGAMQVRGGYIVIGADDRGELSGDLDDMDLRGFDEASLSPMLLKWLPEPLELRTRIASRMGHTVVVVYVGRSPSGCAFFRNDGSFTKEGRDVVVFRAGDVFWRDGTRSVRMSQQGLRGVIERRVDDARADWIAEQQAIRRREREELETAYEGRRLTEAPLGTISFDLEASALTTAFLELLRRDDRIAIQHLLLDAIPRARRSIERLEIETELGDLADKLACIGATLLEYEEERWFSRVVTTMGQIYSLPLGKDDTRRLGFSARIDPRQLAPRLWLLVIRRVFALGALAVRRAEWNAVRTLALYRPDHLPNYDPNWLRHALTMASRAQHLEERRDGRTLTISLLSLAREDVARLACLRPDALDPEDDEILTSLTEFDVLSNLVAIDGAGSAEGRVFYPNFARFRQERIQAIVDRLLIDREMRQILFTQNDEALAAALRAVGERASQEGLSFDGFEGWERTAIASFIAMRPNAHDA